MQEVSQGSMKLQAHHDKIFNSTSQSMKNNFLQDQIYYLTQFRDQYKTLQITLKPNSNIIIHRIYKLIQNLREQISSEVVLTRRETSLTELPLSQFFQETIVCKYEEEVVSLDKRLQRIEELVQRQQDRNRANPVVSKLNILNFKSIIVKKIIEEFLRRNQVVQDLIKYKLMLASKLKEQTQKYRKNCFVNANQANMTQRQYLSHKHHKKLYRNTTLPARLINLASKVQKTTKNNRSDFSKCSIHNLGQIQKAIFQTQLDTIKCQNMKLQKSIDNLKQAISQRQNKKMLKMLSNHKDLQIEESKARQLLFYMLNSQKLEEKIKSCSYIWANKNPNISHKNIFKSHQESKQQQRKTQLRAIYRTKVERSPSLSLKKCQLNKDLLQVKQEKEDLLYKLNQFKKQMKLYLLRSNEKTNQSVQCVDGDN